MTTSSAPPEKKQKRFNDPPVHTLSDSQYLDLITSYLYALAFRPDLIEPSEMPEAKELYAEMLRRRNSILSKLPDSRRLLLAEEAAQYPHPVAVCERISTLEKAVRCALTLMGRHKAQPSFEYGVAWRLLNQALNKPTSVPYFKLPKHGDS